MNLTIEEQLANYRNRESEIKGQGIKHPICEGFYKIKQIHKITEYASKVVITVTADWKSLNSVKNDEACTIELRLDPLFYLESKGVKEVQPISLLGNIVKVQAVEVYQQEYNHELGTYIKVTWSLHVVNKEVCQTSPNETLLDGNTSKVTDNDQIKSLLNSKPNFQ